MRNSTLILLTTILMLTLGSSVAMAGHTFTANDSTIVVWFDEGEPGDLVTSEEITSHLTPAFRAQLPDVIKVKKRIIMTCCTDPTGYVSTDRVAALFPDDVRFNKHNADRDLDGGTNDAREASGNMYLGYMGVNPKLIQLEYIHIRSLKYGDRYVEITITDLLPNQKPVERVIERVVTERVIERPVETLLFDCEQHDLDLAFMGGLRTTEFAVSPTAEVTLTLNSQWLVQGWGMHSAFLRNERDTFAPDTETLDQGGGIRVGTRAYKSLWVLGGTFIEENVLTNAPYAGKRPWWRTGADLSITLRRDHFALTVSGLYGHEWDFSNNGLDTTSAIRFAAVFGDTWRLK